MNASSLPKNRRANVPYGFRLATRARHMAGVVARTTGDRDDEAFLLHVADEMQELQGRAIELERQIAHERAEHDRELRRLGKESGS